MQKISSLLKNLESNTRLNGVVFTEGDDFRWDHAANTIFYKTTGLDNPYYLLHEAGHAALGHQEYPDDMALIAMERAAWDEALALGAQYGIVIPDDSIEDALDSYRDWIHARATCPKCRAIGIQATQETYRCIACHTDWKVNEARSCALRRYTV